MIFDAFFLETMDEFLSLFIFVSPQASLALWPGERLSKKGRTLGHWDTETLGHREGGKGSKKLPPHPQIPQS